jgi:transposase
MTFALLWIAMNELPTTGGHPFYQRLNQVLDTHAFDDFVETQCAPFYAAKLGRPSLTPGSYFRLLRTYIAEPDRGRRRWKSGRD